MKPLILLSTLSLALLSCEKRSSTPAESAPATPTVSIADETFILASAANLPAPVGKTLLTETTLDMRDATLNLEMQGQLIEGTVTQSSTEAWSVTMLTPTKARHLLTRYSEEGSATVAGQQQPNPSTPKPLLNLPLIVENAADFWTATLESGTPTAEQETDLEKIAESYRNRPDLTLYGSDARKPGDAWPVEVSQLKTFAGLTHLKGTFNVEFKSVKEIQGVPCALFTFQFDISGKPAGEKSEPPPAVTLKGTANVVRSLIDLTDLEMTLNAATTISAPPADDVSMNISGDTKITMKATIKG